MNKGINIPTGWREAKLGSVIGIYGGYAFKSSDQLEAGVRWLKIANVGIGKIVWNEKSFLPESYSEDHKQFILKYGDIVLALTRPTLNNKLKIAQINKLDSGCLLNQRVGKITIKQNDLDQQFIFHRLRSDEIAFRINQQLAGTDPPNLSAFVFDQIKILLPPLQEQKAIADILEKWDEAIEKTSKLIDAKRKKFEWLLNNLIKKQQGYEYESLKLVDCCKKITTGKLDANAMVKNGKYRFYTCAKEHYFIDDYKFDGEALLVSGNGANVGYIHYYKGKFNAYQRTYVLMNFYKNIHYIKYCLDKNLSKRINAQVNGGNTPYIKLETISEMMIEIPNSKILQENIVNTLNTAKKEITILEEILAKYKNQKKGLMQNLLTGKWRVNLRRRAKNV